MAQGSPFAIRGVMLDPARLVERHEFYFDLLPHLARWGLNTLWWHFVDDQGFVLQLDSRPELATPYAFSKDEVRRFVAAAAEVGIEVVPEVECLGHAQFITRLPRYAHLADGKGGVFNAACPSHPQTLELFGDILPEVAELFPSRYFHAGLDEVNTAGCPRCAARSQGKPDRWIYAEHVRAIHAILTGCGKRMVMWADHVEHDPSLREELPRDVVLCHWQYYQLRPEPIRASVAAGFDVVLAPALCRSGDLIQPNRHGFDNTDAMTELAASLGERCLGVVNTWWVPWRLVRDAALFAVAYTGRILSQGGPVEKVAFAKEFVAEFFGVQSATAGRAVWELHELTPRREVLQPLLLHGGADLPAMLEVARSPDFATRARTIEHVLNALAGLAGRVERHREEFAAILLAGRVNAALHANGLAWLAVSDIAAQARRDHQANVEPARVAEQLSRAADRLADAQARLEAVTAELDAEWDRTRHADDVKKGSTHVADAAERGQDSLLARMTQCRDYQAALLADLRAAAAASAQGGPFPNLPV